MKIRNQTLMILGVTFIILFAFLIGFTVQVLGNSFSQLENNEVSQNVGRATAALDTRIDDLAVTANDWGHWDDTYNFVLGEFNYYVTNNLESSTIANLQLNMMLFYNNSGKLYYAAGADIYGHEEKDIPLSLLEYLGTQEFLFSRPGHPVYISGILNTPEGPLLIAVNPITPSTDDTTIAGTYMVARYMDTALIEELEETTALSLNTWPLNTGNITSDAVKLSSVLEADGNLYVRPENETSIMGTTLLNDISGNPVLGLDVEMPRDIYHQGRYAAHYVLTAILLIAITCGIVLKVLLDRSLLDRFSLLTSNLKQITDNGSLSSRVEISGNDELKDLANNINYMLEALENNEIKINQVENETRQRMETVLSSIICGTLLIDAETHIITDVNPTAMDVIGLPKEKIVGNVCYDLLFPLQKEGYSALNFDNIENKSESILVNADGEEIPVFMSIVPVSLSDKRYLVGSFVDLSRIKDAEKSLRESEEKFKKISDSAQDAIIMIDNKGAINFWNSAAEKMFDHTKEEVIGKDVHDLIAPPKYKDSYKKGIAEFANEGKGPAIGKILSLDAMKKNGTEFPVEISLSAFELRDGTWNAAGIIRDISDRKKAEEALLAAKISAEVANRAKSEFLANMSHELRTPLNSIIGFSDLMLGGSIADPEMQKKFMGNISTSGKHLLSLINNILDLSKIEAGKMELHYELFGPNATIDEVKQLVSPLADKKGIKLEFTKDEILGKIYADRLRFKQILFNLTSNAIKFTQPGGKITISAIRIEDKAQFSVEDTGIGISEDNKRKLFQPFTQLDSSTTRKYEGTGLGLSLVKRFVEMQNGKIWIESELGKGTKFTFELPSEPVSNENTGIKVQDISAPKEDIQNIPETGLHQQLTIDSANSKGDGPLILVVEDDAPSRELLEVTLVHEGYRVASAKNGKEALELAGKMKPFAIILDIMMPGMNGWDVLKYLKDKEHTQNIPVIIASMIEEHELSVVWGSVEHFIKPVQKDALLNALERFREKIPKSPMNVLVVDDEINAVELISSMLSGEEFNVLVAYGGKEAIDIVSRNRPDVIILDLMMPEVSGFDVIEALKSDPETIDIPVIICTAKDLDLREAESLNKDVSSIMHKGMFTKDDIIRLMKKMQDKKNKSKS